MSVLVRVRCLRDPLVGIFFWHSLRTSVISGSIWNPPLLTSQSYYPSHDDPRREEKRGERKPGNGQGIGDTQSSVVVSGCDFSPPTGRRDSWVRRSGGVHTIYHVVNTLLMAEGKFPKSPLRDRLITDHLPVVYRTTDSKVVDSLRDPELRN